MVSKLLNSGSVQHQPHQALSSGAFQSETNDDDDVIHACAYLLVVFWRKIKRYQVPGSKHTGFETYSPAQKMVA